MILVMDKTIIVATLIAQDDPPLFAARVNRIADEPLPPGENDADAFPPPGSTVHDYLRMGWRPDPRLRRPFLVFYREFPA